MAKKIMLNPQTMKEILDKFLLGVPIRKLHKDFKLKMTAANLHKLCQAYLKNPDEKVWFCEWFNNMPKEFRVPDRYQFVGDFPFGAWFDKKEKVFYKINSLEELK